MPAADARRTLGPFRPRHAGTVARRPRSAVPRRTDTPGTELKLLVLCVSVHHLGAVDLASGALVRAWAPARLDQRLRPYDVVAGRLGADDDELLDPAEPEAIALEGDLERIGSLTGRDVRRYLQPLLHPRDQHLLGCHATAVPFWERIGDHPSIAVIEPDRPAVVAERGGALRCQFSWRAAMVTLPFQDLRVKALMAKRGITRLGTRRGDLLVVALSPPLAGQCHKVVAGLLPRP